MRQPIQHLVKVYLDERDGLMYDTTLTNSPSIRTPANWMPGGDIIIPRAVKDEDAKVQLQSYLAKNVHPTAANSDDCIHRKNSESSSP